MIRGRWVSSAAALRSRLTLLVAAAVLAGCATGPERSTERSDAAPAPSSTVSIASSAPPALSAEPAASPGSGSPSLIVWCDITRGDGSRAPTGSSPPSLPAGLPTGSIQPGDDVFGVFFEPRLPHPTLYALGPPGGTCGVDVGTGFVWWIKDSTGFVFSYEESWSVDPPMWMGCPYLTSARQAYIASMSSAGEPIASGLCSPVSGEVIVPISAEAIGLELALVWAGPPKEIGPTLRLHAYMGDAAPGGFGFIAKCATSGSGASRCGTSLAMVAWSVGGGATAADAILAASAATPAP